MAPTERKVNVLKVKYIALFVAQLFLLWLLNQLGIFIVSFFHLPIPGNVVGMILLFILLMTGVIKLKWINEAASFLLKHLVFFFIPIAVGIMTFGALFLQAGLSLFLILIISASIGIIVTGTVSQMLTLKKKVSHS